MRVRLWPWYRRRRCPLCGRMRARISRAQYQRHLKVHLRLMALGLRRHRRGQQ